MSHSWDDARSVAASSFSALGTVELAPADADGLVLAADVVAATDLPAFTSSAMDGWAVAGAPPWRAVGVVDAGSSYGRRLGPGQAVRVATGAPLPEGADAVLRQEDADAGTGPAASVRPRAGVAPPQPGADIRAAATECRAGDVVAERGQRAVPALLGLAAAAGADTLTVVRRPSVEVVVTGDELLHAGPPGRGLVRDALGPMLPAWLVRMGAGPVGVRTVDGSDDALAAALEATAGADLVVTTGSTASGRRDHLHAVLSAAGATLLVDGVDVRPGHPMLLARRADGRPLAGLPGNPLAAVSALLTLVEPVVRALAGRPADEPATRLLSSPVTGHPHDVRLVPVRGGDPVRHVGPAMLRGLGHADGLAVVPPGGLAAGDPVRVLALP